MVFGLNLAPLGLLLAPLGSLGWLGGVGRTLLDYCKYQRFRADAFILHHVLLCYARGPLWDPLKVLQIPCIWAFGCLQGEPWDTLGASWGPRGRLWDTRGASWGSQGCPWSLFGVSRRFPGHSLSSLCTPGDSPGSPPGTPRSLFEVSWGLPGDSPGTPWVLPGLSLIHI